MRVKYLAQERNAVPRPGLEPGPPDPESSALTIRPPRLPFPFIYCNLSLYYLYHTNIDNIKNKLTVVLSGPALFLMSSSTQEYRFLEIHVADTALGLCFKEGHFRAILDSFTQQPDHTFLTSFHPTDFAASTWGGGGGVLP